MPKYPTEAAWNYFLEHHANIRDCVEMFLPVPRMEIPNTRAPIIVDEYSTKIAAAMPPHAHESRGSIPLEPNYKLTDFDQAVKDQDTNKLCDIMNSAWLRAPEDREVYRIPGFSQMCNLLDCTVEGFFDDGSLD